MGGSREYIHDPEKAAEFARSLGLSVGGHHPFVGDWLVKGLYAYRSGKYKGQAYFGTGGSESDRLKDTYNSIKPGESHQKYRPWNRDDPKIPEGIRQKLIRLEDRMNLTRQPSTKPLSRDMIRGEKILVSKHSLPKYNGIYTIQANEIDGSGWFQNNSDCILYFYNANSGGGPSWSLDDRTQDGTNDWFRGGWIEPPNSGGPPLGTRRWEGAGTIKMEFVSIPHESGEPILNSDSGMLQGEISLKSVHGKYLNATPEGRVEWDDDVAHVGEYFRVEQRQNGKIALKGAFDMYLSAQPDGSVEINRREAPPGGWEEFTVEYRSNDVVCLRSCHGKYLSAQEDGTAQWNRDIAPRGGWEEIQIEQYRKTSEPILSEPILNSDQKYVFAHEHMDWHWHNERARAMGGHIASITSAQENEQITRISGGAPVWIGGIRKGARYRGKPIADRKGGEIGEVGPGADDWYWSDGRPWTYTNWGPGEPNNWDAGENRVQHLGKFDAVWNDVGEDWEGPAVYTVPSTAPEGTGASDVDSSKTSAMMAFVTGIGLLVPGLSLLIVGTITDGEDRLAMIIPGAVLFGVGSFSMLVSAMVGLSLRRKSVLNQNTESTKLVQNPSIEILEAVVGEPVRFRIKDQANDNDAWVGIYPSSLEDNDHGEEGDRWKWLKDIDLDSASFPEQSEGRWSIRVFKDGGYAVVSRVDFDILPKKERWWDD